MEAACKYRFKNKKMHYLILNIEIIYSGMS